MDSIIEFLAHRFTSWQIIILGVVTTLAGIVAVTLVAHLCYNAMPDAWPWIAGGHLVGVVLAGWFIPKIFADAYVYRSWVEQIVANLRALNSFDAEPEEAK
ncbi:MAG TPA: hypothetical protein VJ617_12140 [Arthrobacter sp.]|nr:hypothetical protein [Arthrobacter sp.]